MRKALLSVLLSLSAVTALAATPAQLLADYAAEAARQSPGFQPSARRGAEFHVRRFAVSEKMPACAACHTERPD